VVEFDARLSDEADRKAIEHLIDTFKVDCNRVTSSPLPNPSNTSSPSPSSESPASPSASPSPSPNPAPNRNYNAPNPNVPGTGSAGGSQMSADDCFSKGGHPVQPGTDGDGDGDGCAGE
jgi:hypothetical protein